MPPAPTRRHWEMIYPRSETLSRLLSHNEPPTSKDIASLRTTCAQATTARVTLDMNPPGYFSATFRDAKRKYLVQLEADHRTANSVSRRLPVEIICIIFEYCMGGQAYNVWDTSAGPWSLLRVCRKWNVIAKELCPSIWTNMIIPHLILQDTANLFPLILARTQSRPISFNIFAVPTDNLSYPRLTRLWAHSCEMFRLLAAESERWVEVEVTVGLNISATLLMKDVSGRLPLLQAINIVNTDEAHAHSGLPPEHIDALATAPRLAHLSLVGWTFQLTFSLPLDNLTSFFLVNRYFDRPTMTEEECLLAIIRMPNLRIFGHEDSYVTSRIEHYTGQRYIFPHLEVLYTNSSFFLNALCLPSAQKVELTHEALTSFTQVPNVWGLSFLITASGCRDSLHSLTLTNQWFVWSEGHLYRILSNLPNLKNFAIMVTFNMKGGSYDEDLRLLFNRMDVIVNPSNMPIWHELAPTLTSLSINLLITQEVYALSFLHPGFVTMLGGRFRGYLQNFYLRITFANGMRPAFVHESNSAWGVMDLLEAVNAALWSAHETEDRIDN